MTDPVFVDTNVLVYDRDRRDRAKHERARATDRRFKLPDRGGPTPARPVHALRPASDDGAVCLLRGAQAASMAIVRPNLAKGCRNLTDLRRGSRRRRPLSRREDHPRP